MKRHPGSNPDLQQLSTKPSSPIAADEEWDYTWVPSASTQIRFISHKSRVYNPKWGLQWPYVDIDFYSEDAKNIWFHHGEILTYRRDIVFPLVLRPFHGTWLYAPRDSVRYSVQTYGDLRRCQSGYSHKTGHGWNATWLWCNSFNDVYPFVRRDNSSGMAMYETLVLGSRSLYSVVIGEPPSSVINKWTFKYIQWLICNSLLIAIAEDAINNIGSCVNDLLNILD